MCEFGYAEGCREDDKFKVSTGKLAPPGFTPVVMQACFTHLVNAIAEQLMNNGNLKRDGARGTDDIRLEVLGEFVP